MFEVDMSWPKLPRGWKLGQVSGLDVDAGNHTWLIHRPWSIARSDDPHVAPAPPVIELDEGGEVVRAWGGPGDGFEWPAEEHTIHVDGRGFVWISSAGGPRTLEGTENQILKFTTDGRFVLQVGKRGQSKGSLDPENLNNAADIFVAPSRYEVFVADGYINRRVIVLDADTGKCKRYWGAYGKPPDDAVPHTILGGAPPPQFRVVHGIRVANDGLVYVADRMNDRIQTFTMDGEFLSEHFIVNHRAQLGAAVSIALSSDPRQLYLLVADADHARVRLLDRSTMQEVGHFGSHGFERGTFAFLHNVAMDANGNIYTSEIAGMRVQRFLPKTH